MVGSYYKQVKEKWIKHLLLPKPLPECKLDLVKSEPLLLAPVSYKADNAPAEQGATSLRSL